MIDLSAIGRYAWKAFPWMVTGAVCVMYVSSPGFVVESDLKACLSRGERLRSANVALRSEVVSMDSLLFMLLGLDDVETRRSALNIQRYVAD